MYGMLLPTKPARRSYWAYPPLQIDVASVRIGARADILMLLEAGLEQEAAITFTAVAPPCFVRSRGRPPLPTNLPTHCHARYLPTALHNISCNTR